MSNWPAAFVFVLCMANIVYLLARGEINAAYLLLFIAGQTPFWDQKDA